MKNILLTLIILQLSEFTFAQTGGKEELVQSDTVRIALGFNKMIFKYYLKPSEYGRFQIYDLDRKTLIQSDTLESFSMASYEDVNFDGILDLKIVVMLGASGGDITEYYIYNKQSGLFEPKIGDLSQPEINPKDSTITESSSCCAGRGGSSSTYKYINGVLTLIREGAYSWDSSYTKQLVNGSLIKTSFSKTTIIGEFNGQQIIVDSSWEYLFGKLRLIQVENKRTLDDSSAERLKGVEVVNGDVMGTFIYDSSEFYQYVIADNGKIKCNYLHEQNRNNKWVTIKERSWFVNE